MLSSGFVVDVICPHCEGELELEDGSSGDFECPLCEGEFEWFGNELDTDSSELFNLKQYSIKQKLEVRLGQHFVFNDSNEHAIAYAWKRPFKLKEELLITTDPEYKNRIFVINQMNISDAWGEFIFTLSGDNSRIGSTKRKVLKSTIQEFWEIFDASEQSIGEMRDDWAGKDMVDKMKANSKKLFSGLHSPSFSIHIGGKKSATFYENRTRTLSVEIESNSAADHKIIAAMAMCKMALAPKD